MDTGRMHGKCMGRVLDALVHVGRRPEAMDLVSASAMIVEVVRIFATCVPGRFR